MLMSGEYHDQNIQAVFETLDRIWLPLLGYSKGQEKSKNLEAQYRAVIESGVMSRLHSHVRDLALTQIGKPPRDLSQNDEVYKFSFRRRWPKEYSKIIGEGDKNTIPFLEEYFAELLQEIIQLGCAFRLMHLADIEEPIYSDPNISISSAVRSEWFQDAFAADIALEDWRKEHATPTPDTVITAYIDESVTPFYKSQKVGGFMGWNYGKFSGHAKMLFYAGILLVLKYEAQLDSNIVR